MEHALFVIDIHARVVSETLLPKAENIKLKQIENYYVNLSEKFNNPDKEIEYVIPDIPDFDKSDRKKVPFFVILSKHQLLNDLIQKIDSNEIRCNIKDLISFRIHCFKSLKTKTTIFCIQKRPKKHFIIKIFLFPIKRQTKFHQSTTPRDFSLI